MKRRANVVTIAVGAFAVAYLAISVWASVDPVSYYTLKDGVREPLVKARSSSGIARWWRCRSVNRPLLSGQRDS
jgi:hypothetical protein